MFGANCPVSPWRTGGSSAHPHHRISSEDRLVTVRNIGIEGGSRPPHPLMPHGHQAIRRSDLPSGGELGPDMRTSVRNATGKDKERTVYESLRALLPDCGKYQAKNSDSEFTNIAPQRSVQ
jgi:hypothetical protein